MFTDSPEGQTQSDQHEHDGITSPVPRSHCVTCLREELERLRADALDALGTMESWADDIGRDPCDNEIYCRLKDAVKNFGSAESA